MIQIIGTELYQWDTGRSTQVTDTGASHVHFANVGDSKAVIMELTDTTVKIPDYLLQTGKQLCVYLVNNGATVEKKVFPVRKRERPEDYVYDEDQRNFIYELIHAAEDATDAANKIAKDLQEAKENGEFNGPPGEQGPQGPKGDTGEQGLQGEKGDTGPSGPTGPSGENGKDGYTPQKGVDYFDGNDGKDGQPGKDGTSATHNWNGTVLTITSASGTSSANLKGEKGDKGDPGEQGIQGPKGDQGSPGQNGAAGANGVSATHNWNGTTLTITSASGTSSADLKGEKGDTGAQGIQGIQGEPGAKGEKGDKGDKGEQGIQGADGVDGKDGADYVLTDADKDEIAEIVKAEVPLVKTAEQPTFVNSIDEMTDKTKVYVMPDGYMYGYRESEAVNYNLLKVSEVSFSSRLQNDAEGIVSSTNNNAVTGWFPVTYGKYYVLSCYATDLGKRTHLRTSIQRVQLKLADGTVKLYALDTYPKITVADGPALGVDDENAVYMRLQFQLRPNSSSTTADISTANNLKACKPMIVEGDTPAEAYSNAVNFAYLDGDEGAESIAEWYNTGLAYNQPANYEGRIVELESDVSALQSDIAELEANADNVEDAELTARYNTSLLYEVQKRISNDWRIPFIDVFHKLGLGSNHIIPNSYNVWGGAGNDLTQKAVMMSDGVHPYNGDGVTMMYANAIVPQLKSVPPLYSADSENDNWAGKTMLWMGTSIPAGSDPALGDEGIGTTYPDITANKLGATCTNIAKGSSCVRINSSSGDYNAFKYAHFIRALSRTKAEADIVQANWNTIKTNVVDAASAISADDLAIMKAHSFETLLLPYLDGTNAMPDLFVIDHGHNDTRPLGADGKQDSLVQPTVENIKSGILAEDSYMTENNYANLKKALNNDLSKIADVASFAASLNRNCLIGALNFIITLIYRYNPKARIVIVSDYN